MSTIDSLVTTIHNNATEPATAPKIPAALPPAQELALPQVAWSDGVTSVLEEIAKFLKQARAQHPETKRAQSDARYQQALAQVDELHEKADAIRSGGFASAVLLGASAGCAWGAFESGDEQSQLWTGLARGFDGASDLSGRFADAAATDHEAAAKGHEALGDRYRDWADATNDRARELGEIMTKAHDAIRAVLEARHAARMAAIGTRG